MNIGDRPRNIQFYFEDYLMSLDSMYEKYFFQRIIFPLLRELWKSSYYALLKPTPTRMNHN